MKKLAFYTCFFGSSNNYSYLIPPIPSEKYDSYFFTNNKDIYDSLNNKWIKIFVNIPIHDNTMETKLLRCCPHMFDVLNIYEYLCWFDNKLLVYEDKVEELIDRMGEKLIVLSKHPYSDNFKSVWDEFNLSMGTEKYYQQKDQYIKYINNQLQNGFSENIDIHFCGGWTLRKMCKKTEEFGELWHKHILECGIEDQISLQFIKQIYKDFILPTETKYAWKCFYE